MQLDTTFAHMNSFMGGNRVYMRDDFLNSMYICSWKSQLNELNIFDDSFFFSLS